MIPKQYAVHGTSTFSILPLVLFPLMKKCLKRQITPSDYYVIHLCV